MAMAAFFILFCHYNPQSHSLGIKEMQLVVTKTSENGQVTTYVRTGAGIPGVLGLTVLPRSAQAVSYAYVGENRKGENT